MRIWTSCIFLIFGVVLGSGVPVKESNTCGYDSCNLGDSSKLNVHIVSHSHNDLGYRKTVDQYFYGALNWIQRGSVQYILDSAIEALGENPDRKFIYAEVAYLWRWWNQQSDDIRNQVKDLVNSGRLEFVSGGWSMSDEASTHYSSIIDHHSLGTEFLNNTFGACARPRVGWQIAPFGHSREHASLQAQMGLDGLFFSRADYRDYSARSSTKTMEMIWKASANLDSKAWLFAGLLPYQYGPPASLCFDFFCGDQPVMDNPLYHDYNVPERVQTFIQAAQNEAAMFATNHIMMTMGNDFQYENAHEWFKNMDKLIKYVNAQQANGSNVNVFYSTPSCYVYALNKAGHTWPTKTDDFFPFAHHSHGFWTGLFTSRATLKGYERHANHILQVTRQLNALSNSQSRQNIFRLSEALGVLQHLDGLSGTERQEVAYDYAQRVSMGIDDAIIVINQSYSKLLPKNGQSIPPQYLCQLSNISECLPIENQTRFTLTLWNPTIHPVVHHAHVPVTKDYLVRDPTGQIISTETLPISNATRNIPGRSSAAMNQVIFAANLPALGFNTYFFEAKTNEEREKSKIKITENDECILQNEYLRIEIDAQGNLQRVVSLQNNVTISFSNQGFYWYQGYPGNNSQPQFQASGLYIFRPLSPTAQPVSTARTITCIKAETVQTAIITFDNWATEEMNLYDNEQYVEIEWTVGPVPISDNAGKEIILRYDTDIQSAGKYYTDANGREVLERTRDSRPTWNYTGDEPVSGNYYPVNSRIWIKDNNRQLTVLTDRSEGGASISDGSVEIMIHRRVLTDDALGIGECLNETAFAQGLVVRGKHLLIIDQPSTSARLHRVTAQNYYMRPLATFGLPQENYANYSADFRQTWSGLTNLLPLNVHLLTFDQLDSKTYLLRLEHYFELNEDMNYSQPIAVDLQSIFTTVGTVSNVVELTLTANSPIANVQRLNWTTTDGESMTLDIQKEISLRDTSVTLTPMEIRTFQVAVA